MVEAAGRAALWRRSGTHFTWSPSTDVDAVEVFHVECGDPDNPALLLVHGFPTCSVDWIEVADLLSDTFYVCALDFPGYGFSGKPPGWGYSLARDAALLDHYLGEIAGAEAAVVVAHDRGTSVSLLHTLDDLAGRTATHVEHLVLTNGNVYLPLSNLTDFQRLVLDPVTAPSVLEVMTPAMLAEGMGRLTFSPPRASGSAEVEAMTATFAHDDGVRVLHETIQYLVERSEGETDWLASLSRSELPTTLIWGITDPVSPLRVAAHVWDDFLMLKPGANRFYLVPEANHYLQNDRPAALAMAIRHTLDASSDTAPGPIEPTAGAPVLVDCSRPRMPSSREVLAGK